MDTKQIYNQYVNATHSNRPKMTNTKQEPMLDDNGEPMQCDTCNKDLFTLTVDYDDGTQEIKERVNCICDKQREAQAKQKLINAKKFYDKSYMELEYQRASFDVLNIENDQQQKAIETTKAYISNFENHLKTGKGLIYQGSFGTGKTYLSAIVCNEIYQKGYKTLFIPFSEYFNQMATYKKDFQMDAPIFQYAKDAELLVLDEINVNLNSWERSELYRIVDARKGKSTIYTTNYSSKDFKSTIELNQIFSRMMQRKEIIILNGKDYRTKEMF